MTDHLFDPPTPIPTLTPRQAHAYRLVQTTPGGITADELGAATHADQGRHSIDERCEWCAKLGLDLMRSKALAPLVVRRRESGRYEPRDGSGTPLLHVPSTQLVELPGSSFEDIFDMEAAS